MTIIDPNIPFVEQPFAIFLIMLVVGPILFLSALSVLGQIFMWILQNGVWILFFALIIWLNWK